MVVKDICEPCVYGNAAMTPMPCAGGVRAARRLQLVHSDLDRPMSEPSRGGALYFGTFIEDFSITRPRKARPQDVQQSAAAAIIGSSVAAKTRTADTLTCLVGPTDVQEAMTDADATASTVLGTGTAAAADKKKVVRGAAVDKKKVVDAAFAATVLMTATENVQPKTANSSSKAHGPGASTSAPQNAWGSGVATTEPCRPTQRGPVAAASLCTRSCAGVCVNTSACRATQRRKRASSQLRRHRVHQRAQRYGKRQRSGEVRSSGVGGRGWGATRGAGRRGACIVGIGPVLLSPPLMQLSPLKSATWQDSSPHVCCRNGFSLL